MDILNKVSLETLLLHWLAVTLLLLVVFWTMIKIVAWGKTMSRGAFLFLAFFPLISLFPIPPPQFENVQKAKQEQRKRKEDSGDPPENE
ncbi:hypothetical protein HH219_17500 [Pseudoalteromonas sp. NEC-BIFX-2020_015]|uniref:hypothetical protein n=1 Tax=Pseudoalteromonas sp. NEC-BIFX-2020_015 TaxID=2729544 RepID=UPI0014615740|nr:hypothetical protein [Pseudoalteromonas sp. NEC-BIFX-2020_015]NMR27308.1 hypothetical protein [Pseudoalteromonas sp. NEC-BIFX-2020_015]